MNASKPEATQAETATATGSIIEGHGDWYASKLQQARESDWGSMTREERRAELLARRAGR